MLADETSMSWLLMAVGDTDQWRETKPRRGSEPGRDEYCLVVLQVHVALLPFRAALQ